MSTITREKRVSRPRNIFSPGDSSIQPSHYLLHFQSTDSYKIALSSSIITITDNTATVNIHGRKTFATIITSGTMEFCVNEQKTRTRESQQFFDEGQPLNWDDDEDLDRPFPLHHEGLVKTFSSASHQTTENLTHRDRCSSPHHEGLVGTFSSAGDQITKKVTHRVQPLLNNESDDSDINIDDNDAELTHEFVRSSRPGDTLNSKQKSVVNRKKRKEPPARSSKPKRKRQDIGNSAEVEQVAGDTNPPMQNEMYAKDVLTQIENHIVIFQNLMTKNLKRMEKKIDHHLGSNPYQGSRALDQYRISKGEIFQTEYKYQNRNLLATPAKDLMDFARQTMRILFSPEELKTHIIPPERDHLKRPALNQERFDILIEAIRIKFRLDSDLMQQCFNDLLRTKLSNFLYEERRRDSRRRLRDQERMLKLNTLQPTQNDYHENIDEEGEERI